MGTRRVKATLFVSTPLILTGLCVHFQGCVAGKERVQTGETIRAGSAQEPVSVRLVSKKQWTLHPGSQVQRGESLALQMSLAKDQWVYLQWVDAKGQASLVYGSKERAEEAGAILLPPGGVIKVGGPVGPGHLVVVTSSSPLNVQALHQFLPLTSGETARRAAPMTLATRGGRVDIEGVVHLRPDEQGICANAIKLRVTR